MIKAIIHNLFPTPIYTNNLDRGFTPGFEDPIKIQKVQRERLTPQSQKFIDFENPKDRDKIYNKTEVKRK